MFYNFRVIGFNQTLNYLLYVYKRYFSDIILSLESMDKPIDQQSNQSAPCPIFIFSILSGGSAIALAILLYIWGYMGFSGTSSLTITACTTTYHTFKYSNLTIINQIIFCVSTVAAGAGLIIVLCSISLLVKKCNNTVNRLSQCFKGTLYFFICLMILGDIIPCGYYLTYIIEGSKCTVTFVSIQMILILTLAASTIVIGLILLTIVNCCLNSKQSNEEKYKQMETHQTEPNKIQKEKDEYHYYRRQVKEQFTRFRAREDTKQNIFDTPSKSPIERRPIKPEPIYLSKKDNTGTGELRFVARDRSQNPILNIHPSLVGEKGPQYNRLTDAKLTKNALEQDDQYMKEEHRRYLKEYNTNAPILSKNGAQQTYRERNRYRDHLRQDEYPNNSRNNSNERPRQRHQDRYDYGDRDNYGSNNRDRYANRSQDLYDSRNRENNRYKSPYQQNSSNERHPNKYIRDTLPPRRRQQSPLKMANRQGAMLNFVRNNNY